MQLVTIATKLIRLTDQIIVSLYLKYLYNQMISLKDMVSSSFVVFARNVLYVLSNKQFVDIFLLGIGLVFDHVGDNGGGVVKGKNTPKEFMEWVMQNGTNHRVPEIKTYFSRFACFNRKRFALSGF